MPSFTDRLTTGFLHAGLLGFFFGFSHSQSSRVRCGVLVEAMSGVEVDVSTVGLKPVKSDVAVCLAACILVMVRFAGCVLASARVSWFSTKRE